MVGEFMKYMPITVMFTLTASLFMALIFIPVVGGTIGRRVSASTVVQTKKMTHQSAKTAEGLTLKYLKVLWKLLNHPGKVLAATVVFLVGTYITYGRLGAGVEFFPYQEPEFIQVEVHARGDLSIYEKDQIMHDIENRLLSMDYLDAVYTRTTNSGGGQQGGGTEDTIGVVQLDFVDWDLRPTAIELRESRSKPAY
jgi:multidrug efflux pump